MIEEENRDKKKRWIFLNKPLFNYTTTDIDEEIVKAARKLVELRKQKRKGKRVIKHRERIRDIRGIPIIYAKNGGNRVIKYEAPVPQNRMEEIKFQADVEIIMLELSMMGLKPEKGCERTEVCEY